MAAEQQPAVVVTGASTGIGRATALDLAAHGFEVFAGVRKKRDADGLRAEAAEALGSARRPGRLSPITLDVSKGRSISAAKAKVQRAVGSRGLAGLVNNAGIGSAGPVETMPIAEFKRVVDVNLIGSVQTTQEFMPLLRKARGRVLFITSIGGRVSSPFFAAYNASKFGLEGVADSLRREMLPFGVDVVVIEPGSISTPIWGKGRDNTDAALAGTSPGAARLYAEAMERMREVTREADARGLPPEKVAEVVRKALTARRPHTRYLVGRDAKVMYRAQKLLGDRRFDRLMRSQLELPDGDPG